MRRFVMVLVAFLACASASASLEEDTSYAVARIARIDLRMQHDPGPDSYRATYLTLSIAQELAPDDAELTRDLIQAAYNAGDERGVIKQTRRLIRLDPRDTVAQLRLIAWNIGQLQTAEQRLDAYDRFLGPAGEKIDAAVRSRLALDAAMIARELGDHDGFVRRLTRASQLDPTNKEAASMALAYFADQTDDPGGRYELLLNILASDPLDANVYRWLMLELAQHAAYHGARHFQMSAAALLRAGDQELPQAQEVERLALDWHVRGVRSVFDQLQKDLQEKRFTAQSWLNAFDNGSIDELPDDFVAPDKVHLETPGELFRIFSADALDETDTLAEALTAFEEIVNDRIAEAESHTDAPPEAISRYAYFQRYELFRVKALFADKEKFDELAALLRRDAGDNEVITKDIDAWTALRAGKPEDALGYFEVAPEGELVSAIGRALTYEALGRDDDAAVVWRRVVLGNGLTPYGCWARERLRQLTGEDRPSDEWTARLERNAAAIPRWLDEMILDPSSFIDLRVEPVAERGLPTDEVKLRITLRNTAPIPLALGPNKTINSSMLISTRAEVELDELVGQVQTEVAELERRLRLRPRESLVVEVPTRGGYTGWLLETLGSRTIRSRWRVLQGFVMGGKGYFVPGPLCVAAGSEPRLDSPLPSSHLTPEELATRVRNAPEHDLPEITASVRSVLLAPEALKTPPTDVQRREIASACADRYEQASPTARLLMLASLPHAGQAPEMSDLDELARRDLDPRVLAFAVLTRMTKPDDALIERAAELGDERAGELARLVARREQEGLKGYAYATPKLDSIAGIFRGSATLDELKQDEFEREFGK